MNRDPRCPTCNTRHTEMRPCRKSTGRHPAKPSKARK